MGRVDGLSLCFVVAAVKIARGRGAGPNERLDWAREGLTNELTNERQVDANQNMRNIQGTEKNMRESEKRRIKIKPCRAHISGGK